MEIRIVTTYNTFYGVNEVVYDIIINDYRHLFVRKSIYDKFQSGEYWILKRNSDYLFESKEGLVKRYNEVVY